MLGGSPGPALASSTHNYRGVVYGFNNSEGTQNEYWWASASYATLASVGAPKAANYACGIAFDEPWAGKLCYYAAEAAVALWTSIYPQDRYHGILVNWRPNTRPHFSCVHIAYGRGRGQDPPVWVAAVPSVTGGGTANGPRWSPTTRARSPSREP